MGGGHEWQYGLGGSFEWELMLWCALRMQFGDKKVEKKKKKKVEKSPHTPTTKNHPHTNITATGLYSTDLDPQQCGTVDNTPTTGHVFYPHIAFPDIRTMHSTTCLWISEQGKVEVRVKQQAAQCNQIQGQLLRNAMGHVTYCVSRDTLACYCLIFSLSSLLSINQGLLYLGLRSRVALHNMHGMRDRRGQ